MKRLTSWLLVAVVLLSCFAGMALPAAATSGEEAGLTNLYDVEDAVNGRAIEKMAETNVKEVIYLTSAPIEMKAGETVYFGPVNVSQGYQAFFYPKTNTNGGTQIAAGALTEVFKFEGIRCTNADAANTTKPNYMAIYSYTATADGYIRCTLPIEYAEFYVITKDAIDYDTYYAYFDSIEGANLWNQFLDVKNLIGTDGTIGTNANHYATHYIAVEEGDTITWGPHQDSMYYGAFGYDANKAGVTGTIDVGTTTAANDNIKKVATFTDDNNPVALDDNQTYSIYTYTVPEGVSYVRVLLRKEVPGYFMVQKNNEFDVEGYWKLMGGDMESPYFGGTSLWLGDSITQATQDLSVNGVWYGGWVGRVSKALNMNYVHRGESGWSLSTARPGRIVNRLMDGQKDEPADGYDAVMLHGGTNDAWESISVGAMSDSYSPTDFDIDTYAGALEELFYYATTLYGDTAEINYILNYEQPQKMSGQVYMMDAHYAEALKICEKWGVTPIDLYHDEAVKEACALDTMKIYKDWCHATQRGYEIVTPFIVDKMLSATSGNSWSEDQAAVIKSVASDLTAAIAADAHFTDASKATFAATAAAAEGTAWEKLDTILKAALSLKQNPESRISIHDMTKYAFAEPKEFGVYNKTDLVWLANYNNQRGNNNGKTCFGNLPGYIDADYTIYQMNDITMNGSVNIGSGNPFRAVYDGQNYALIGWSASSTSAVGTALFNSIKSTTIKNIVMKNAYISGGQHTALLVGYIHDGNNLIENCHVVGSTLVKTAGNGMAAIALQPASAGVGTDDAYTVRDCTVSDTTFNIAIESGTTANVGFIASRAVIADNVIENCYAYNNKIIVSSGATAASVGGILGEAYTATVRNCGVYGNTYSVASGAAGSFAATTSALVGQVYNATDTLYLDNCYSDMADYSLYKANGTVVGENNYSVKDGTTTVAEITGNVLAAKMNAATDAHWASTPVTDTLSIPMINEELYANRMITLGDNVFYTNSSNGKITATAEELAAVEGKIWRKGNTTLLTKDILKGVFEDEESWYEAEYLLGDCIDSDTLDTADATAILKNLVGKGAEVENYAAERADANADGRVSIADVTRVLRYIIRGQNAA